MGVCQSYAKHVGIGNYTDMLGNDGDKLGFPLAVSGVEGDDPTMMIYVAKIHQKRMIVYSVLTSPHSAPVFEKGKRERDKGEIYDKTDDEGKALHLDSKLFWNYGVVCFAMILILVMGVAVASYSLDKRKKKREIDEQMSISEKIEDHVFFLIFGEWNIHAD